MRPVARASARRSCSAFSATSRCAFSAAFTLNASTARAMLPTSSLRASPGSTTLKLPAASSRMLWVSAVIGLEIERARKKAISPPKTSVNAPMISWILTVRPIEPSVKTRASSNDCLQLRASLGGRRLHLFGLRRDLVEIEIAHLLLKLDVGFRGGRIVVQRNLELADPRPHRLRAAGSLERRDRFRGLGDFARPGSPRPWDQASPACANWRPAR